MKRIFRNVVLTALALMPQMLFSQDCQFNFSLGGGMEILNYTPDIGKPKPGGAFLFECQFQQFFTKHFGYGVGPGISYLTANYFIDETIERQIDGETDAGVPYVECTRFDNFNENQKTLQLELPIGLYLRFNVNEASNFIIGGGPKIDFPLIFKYDYTDGSVERYGRFDGDIKAELHNLPQHGFSTQEPHGSNRIDRDIALLSLYADMLWTYCVNNSSIIHFGAYFSYGLTDMVSHHDASMGVDQTSILNSNLTEKVIPICVGLKVGVTVPCMGGGPGRSSFDGY